MNTDMTLRGKACDQCGRAIAAGERWYLSVPAHLLDKAQTRCVFGEMTICSACIGEAKPDTAYAPQRD